VSVSAPAARRRLADGSYRRLPAWSLTAVFGALYVLVAPVSTDLAAAGYRGELFSRAGLTLWDNGWYGGHHLPAYSLLAPPLGALLGEQLLAALSATAAAALFAALIEGCFPPRATRFAALWFALGAAVGLLSNRIPFELGLALGLGALVAARRWASASASASASGGDRALKHRQLGGGRGLGATPALLLAALCALASPIAGAFLGLAALAWALSDRSPGGRLAPRGRALAVAVAALGPVALLALAFPEGGSEPFVASAFYPVLAAVLLVAIAIPREQRLLRTGAALYALALVAAYAIPTAVGGNVDRLGALVAGPLLACALVGAGHPRRSTAGPPMRGGARLRSVAWRRSGAWRAWALIALAPLLLYWQLRAPIADYASAASDPAASASYYAPLLAELRHLGVGYDARPTRVEVVPTRNRAEARWVAARTPIARGWERQLEQHDDAVFYEHSNELNRSRYGRWLSDEAISYVALPDAPLDYSARAEARLVRSAPGYLREVWRSRHWRLFAVLGARPLTSRPSVLTALGSDSFTLRAPRAGTFTVRVRFTPYWALARGHGCVRRAPGDWTQVQTRGAGSVRVAIDFSLARVFAHGRRCA
jgi:hypothetical protein